MDVEQRSNILHATIRKTTVWDQTALYLSVHFARFYLKGFEIAIRQAQPISIMTSYNLINGVHAANNYDLCTESARNEWGFKGAIMTDWTTTEQGDKLYSIRLHDSRKRPGNAGMLRRSR